MPYYDGLLFRDSTSDTGVVPSPGYPYYSPDIICHDQVADPQSYFTANYSSDPNQPVQLGSNTNFVYVRTKNLSTAAQSNWYVFVYRASSSLFLNTNIWKNNGLNTLGGQPYIQLATVQPNAVAVGGDVFVLGALSSNLFCLIGVASPTSTPNIPNPFTSYSDYITWVRQNQNVCGRNMTLAQNFPNRQYERVDSFSNPESTAVPVLFQVSATGPLPTGTTFGVVCSPLNINTSWNVSQGPIQTTSAMCPAGFNGTVTTWGSLPSGVTQWPTGARIDNTIFVGRSASDPVARYATDFAALSVRREEVEGLEPEGVLVRLGNCATQFVTQ
jgi:hypothetical protein